MQNNRKFATIRGTLSYAKILGDPVLNYSKDGKEWTMDLAIDKGVVKEVKALGIGDKVKSKDNYLDGQSYLTFKQRELRTDPLKGEVPNDPIKVVQIDGKTPWPQDKLLGNGTVAEVRFEVRDYGIGKKKGMYIRAVRVLDLKSFERSDFEPIKEDDEFYVAAQAQMVEAAKVDPNTDRTNPPFDVDDLDDDITI